MRFIGGKYGGRFFKPDKKFRARPTTDLAKEALFNILENRYDFSGWNILDLFAGSGSIGLEFISRGAARVTFVEKNNFHVRFIYGIAGKLGIDNARIIRGDAFRFISRSTGKYDLIFADPPYDLPGFTEIPEQIFEQGMVKAGGLLILEHPGEYDFSAHQGFRELRKYGKVHFSFFAGPDLSAGQDL